MSIFVPPQKPVAGEQRQHLGWTFTYRVGHTGHVWGVSIVPFGEGHEVHLLHHIHDDKPDTWSAAVTAPIMGYVEGEGADLDAAIEALRRRIDGIGVWCNAVLQVLRGDGP